MNDLHQARTASSDVYIIHVRFHPKFRFVFTPHSPQERETETLVLSTITAMSQKLTFTTADMLNTTVSNATDVFYFDILTPEWDANVTTVRRLDPRTGMFEHTGSIRNEKDKPVEVSLYNGAYEPVEQWIKKIDGTKPGER